MPYEHMADILPKVSQKERYFGSNMLEFFFHVLKSIHFDTKKVKIGQLCPDGCMWKLYFASGKVAILKNGQHFIFAWLTGFF